MLTPPDDDPATVNDPEGDATRGRAGLWARAVPLALGMVMLAWVTKLIAVAVGLVAPALLGDHLADRPGVLIGLTAGAVVALALCYLAVTRTGDGAYVVHEIGTESMVWVAAGWAIAMGWLAGDAVSSVGAPVGLLGAAVVVGVVGLMVAGRLDGGLAQTLRRRAVRR